MIFMHCITKGPLRFVESPQAYAQNWNKQSREHKIENQTWTIANSGTYDCIPRNWLMNIKVYFKICM